MKKMSTRKMSVLRSSVFLGLIAGSLLATDTSFGQNIFYSRFDNPTGKYLITLPTGCLAPTIQSTTGFVDNDENSYSFFGGTLLTPLLCSSQRYTFRTQLNLPSDSLYLQAGNNVGWRISVPTGTSLQDLGLNLTINTYLRDALGNLTLQESKTGSDLMGIDIGQDSKGWFIYFTASKSYNVVELTINPAIIKLNLLYQFQVYGAFGGSVSVALPAEVTNVKTAVSGKNVNVSWTSLTETNVSSYRIERSNNNGTYTTVGKLSAKGNNNASHAYSFTDKAGVDGNYLYRVVTINNDGTTKTTGSVSAIISGLGKLLLYPTIVKAGQDVTVKTSENGLVNIYLYDVQGRLVKQQRTNSSGQFNIATTGLNGGVYNIKVVSASGAISQSKIVVN